VHSTWTTRRLCVAGCRRPNQRLGRKLESRTTGLTNATHSPLKKLRFAGSSESSLLSYICKVDL
jgi:hypothetical protein